MELRIVDMTPKNVALGRDAVTGEFGPEYGLVIGQTIILGPTQKLEDIRAMYALLKPDSSIPNPESY